MLRIYAERYVALGQDFQELEMLARTPSHSGITVVSGSEEYLSDSDMNTLAGLIVQVMKHCKEIGLKVTARVADEINTDWGKLNSIAITEAGTRVAELRRCFTAELKDTQCYMILSGRESFYTDDPLVFLTEKTLARFPSVRFDILEAGKCFATERFTACVIHLMRVAEYAYVSFVRYSGPGLSPDAEKNWNKGLNGIHAKIRQKQNPFDKLSDQDEQYFVGLEGYLRTVKTAWRNPASHIPRIFTESQARTVFEVTRTLMNFASESLSEVVLDYQGDANAKGQTA